MCKEKEERRNNEQTDTFVFDFLACEEDSWNYASIKTYGCYFLSRDWVGLKWRPVLKVWEQLKEKKNSKMIQETMRRINGTLEAYLT